MKGVETTLAEGAIFAINHIKGLFKRQNLRRKDRALVFRERSPNSSFKQGKFQVRGAEPEFLS